MNYLICREGWLKTQILYIDLVNQDLKKLHLANILADNNVKVPTIRGIFESKDTDYVLVYVNVWNKQVEKFKKCLTLLSNKFLLLGYTDYDKFATKSIRKIQQDYKELRREKDVRKRNK